MILVRKIKFLFVLCFLTSIYTKSFAQKKDSTPLNIVPASVENGDTVPTVDMWDVYVISMKPYTDSRDIKRYARL